MDKKDVSGLKAKKAFIFPASFYQVWVIASGAYMMGGRCPCCGGQSCPIGLGAAVAVGGGITGITHAVSFLGKGLKAKNKGGCNVGQGIEQQVKEFSN